MSSTAPSMEVPMILQHIPAITDFYYDESISEITMLPSGRVMIEREGQKIMTDIWVAEQNRDSGARICCRLAGEDCSKIQPSSSIILVDKEDPKNFKRMSCVHGSISIDGTTISIRKFRKTRFTAAELMARGMFSQGVLDRLIEALRTRKNILISGAVNTGKTSLVNALGAYLPADEHVVMIEDTSEIVLGIEKLVRLQTRLETATPDGTVTLKEVTAQELLQQTLRLSPNRIIVGEVRGAAAFDLVVAMNTGCKGTISTIHADSAELSLTRLMTCASMGTDLGADRLMQQIAGSINVLVHLEQQGGKRRVDEILDVVGYVNGQCQFESWPLS